ncbi:hypothetical protein ACA910_011645 [Epithemia clementina (nom. ined.)]
MQDGVHAPPHRLEQSADTAPPIPGAVLPPTQQGDDRPSSISLPPPRVRRTQLRYCMPVAYVVVYVDDFIGLVQGGAARRKQVQRVLLHSLDTVMRGLDPTDHPSRQEPASIKKMMKGDATWQTPKTVLGWVLDTVAYTLELPPHRQARLFQILNSVPPTTKHIATKTWHQLVGKLRSMVLAIPGGQGLFSTLQEAFCHPDQCNQKRLKLNRNVHALLSDFRWLARDMAHRPTRLMELVKQEPATIGASDAALAGMGAYTSSLCPTAGTAHICGERRSPRKSNSASCPPSIPTDPSPIATSSLRAPSLIKTC